MFEWCEGEGAGVFRCITKSLQYALPDEFLEYSSPRPRVIFLIPFHQSECSKFDAPRVRELSVLENLGICHCPNDLCFDLNVKSSRYRGIRLVSPVVAPKLVPTRQTKEWENPML